MHGSQTIKITIQVSTFYTCLLMIRRTYIDDRRLKQNVPQQSHGQKSCIIYKKNQDNRHCCEGRIAAPNALLHCYESPKYARGITAVNEVLYM